MRVFITGVAGFLGSHIADAFLERGDLVSGVDNLIGGFDSNVPRGVDWYNGDCVEFARVKEAMRGAEIVIHAAATAHEGLSVFSPSENAHHGYAASSSVFSAACASGVRRILFTSSMARYGKGEGPPPFHEGMRPEPEDPYGIGKWAAERLLFNLAETHGLEAVVAVPHNIIGPRQHSADPFRNVISIFANRMLQGKQPIVYGDGSQERCFSYVSDDVESLVKMALQDNVVGEVINIGPDQEVISVLRAAEMVASVLGFELDPIFKPARPREVKLAHCSADKARQLLGYETKVSLEEAVRRTVEWVRECGPRPFAYHQMGPIEIENSIAKVPETWAKRLF